MPFQRQEVAIAGHDEIRSPHRGRCENLIVIRITRDPRHSPQPDKHGELLILRARGLRDLGRETESFDEHLFELGHKADAGDDLDFSTERPLQQLSWETSEE